MSGFGERFRRAGYTVPKPLIEVEGKPIIAHVLDLFPGETDVLFICNAEHLAEPSYRMADILTQLCPTGRIVGIAPHKLGPVKAVLDAIAHVDPEAPTVVNYCDFTCYWDWAHFKRFVADTRCVGCIPAYRGFHPHTLGSTNYAYLREHNGWVQAIQEKQPYTNNRMQEYASSGTYYFQSGAVMRRAFEATVAQNLHVGGEHYVSLAYPPLLDEGAAVAVYPLQHFMQWGTPEDVAEYNGWSAAFRALVAPAPQPPPASGSVVVPMAGLGQRFANEGYSLTKPLIPVSGLPMVDQATHDLPQALRYSFVLRRDMPGHDVISAELRRRYPGAVIETLERVTEGQAITARIGLEALERPSAAEPITFGACDYGALYDRAAFARLMADPAVDVVVWGARGHANAVRHPQMFGWVAADADGRITGISVKAPLASPATDPIVVGTFTFKRAADVHRVIDRLVARDGRVNGEFYLDSCINDALALGLNCRLFEVEHFLPWGTPNDLRTFTYWQSCFHKWGSHPYRLERDGRVPPSAVADLETEYAAWQPELPGEQPTLPSAAAV